MLFSDITRRQAFLVHLFVSLIIFVALTYLIVFHWYPGFLMDISGGYRGIATIFFVDVVIGPGLTLFLFKPGKKGLKFDMAMVLLFQLSALTWGVHSVYSSRPTLTVFYDGQFNCLSKGDIPSEVVEKISKHETGKPDLAFMQRPDDMDEYLKMMYEAFAQQSSEIYYYPERLTEIDDQSIERIKLYKMDVSKAIDTVNNSEIRKQYKKIWDDYEKNHELSETIQFIPLACRYHNVTAVFDTEKREIIDTVDLYTNRAKSSKKLKIRNEDAKDIKTEYSPSSS